MASIVAAPEGLRYAEARRRVLAAVAPLPPEEVALAAARGRALGRPLVAPHELPPFRNASMDGVAVRTADLRGASPSAPVTLTVVDEIPAGAAPSRALQARECAWIMTGAMIPSGADAVVPIEDLETSGSPPREAVRVRQAAAPGQNVRDAGADARAGETLLEAGRELSAPDLAVLASLGVARPWVGATPRVSVLSTGDELLEVTEPLRPGGIRDSNLPMLGALLEECGARLTAAARLRDDPAIVAAAIERALSDADVVITVGGVSAGRHDPVKLGIGRVGGIALWRVAMKPGRPQAFGAPRGRLFFGLPGNPGSVVCVFEALVRPALRKLQGFTSLERPRLEARAAATIESRPGRTDFVRVTLERREGEWWAREAGAQVSGHVMPQARAHGLLVVPEEIERLGAGETAETIVLRWPDPA